MIDLSKLSKKNRFMFLAYDHGLEHGPTDFTDEDIDPRYILKIAAEGSYTGIIFHKGIADKYYSNSPYSKEIPLILKLNGKTNLVEDEPYSSLICSVNEAKELGAVGVGYTIYVGSKYESLMFKEFGNVVEEAHKNNMPVVAWMYPRGASVKGKEDTKDILAYSARVGLELGADILKMHYAGNIEDMKWVVEAAGNAKIIVSGGAKQEEGSFLNNLKGAVKAGCAGIAVGRNVWQNENPMEITHDIKNILWPI